MMTAKDSPADLLGALLDELADRLAERLNMKAANDNGAPEYYTVETAEKQLAIPPTTFRRLCRTGVFDGAMRIRGWRAPKTSVHAWQAQQGTAARTPADRSDAAPATERSAEELMKLQRSEGTEAKPARRPRRR